MSTDTVESASTSEGPVRLVYGRSGVTVVCDACGSETWTAGPNDAHRTARKHVCKKRRR